MHLGRHAVVVRLVDQDAPDVLLVTDLARLRELRLESRVDRRARALVLEVLLGRLALAHHRRRHAVLALDRLTRVVTPVLLEAGDVLGVVVLLRLLQLRLESRSDRRRAVRRSLALTLVVALLLDLTEVVREVRLDRRLVLHIAGLLRLRQLALERRLDRRRARASSDTRTLRAVDRVARGEQEQDALHRK